MWYVSDGFIIFLSFTVLFLGLIGITAFQILTSSSKSSQKQALPQNESTNKAHTQFLATMSHEIRTPINGIMGLSTILLDSNLNPEQDKLVEMIRSSTESLLTLINDILDYSKIEAGRMNITPIEFNLKKEMINLSETMALLAQRKKLKLKLKIDPKIEPSMFGDINRIKQILINLIGNSIKFTDSGEIQINIKKLREGKKRLQIHFEVKDTGIGISPEKLNKLFMPYSQTHDGQKAFGGSGLGLFICKNLVEKMHGKIGVKSHLQKGSTFWFDLKISKALSQVKPVPMEDFKNKQNFYGRVLLAEDNKVNQLVTQTFLKKVGLQVITVENGHELLSYLEKDSQFDLILMDCQMPVLDGYKTTLAIRQSQKKYAKIPIIALSASVMQEEQTHCFDVGMDDFISKPVSFEALTNKVQPWLQKIAS